MKFTRAQALDYLVERDITDIEQMLADNDIAFIDSVLRAGFDGYESFNNSQLEEEIRHSVADDEEVEVTE
jgi:hypothetical protein